MILSFAKSCIKRMIWTWICPDSSPYMSAMESPLHEAVRDLSSGFFAKNASTRLLNPLQRSASAERVTKRYRYGSSAKAFITREVLPTRRRPVKIVQHAPFLDLSRMPRSFSISFFRSIKSILAFSLSWLRNGQFRTLGFATSISHPIRPSQPACLDCDYPLGHQAPWGKHWMEQRDIDAPVLYNVSSRQISVRVRPSRPACGKTAEIHDRKTARPVAKQDSLKYGR